MPSLIIHKDGAFNLFTTVADGACYEGALTLDELRAELPVDGFEERLQRALATGCSSIKGTTLLECITFNRAGPKESCMPVDEFIGKFLTLVSTGSEA